jgi:hypothetical protein
MDFGMLLCLFGVVFSRIIVEIFHLDISISMFTMLIGVILLIRLNTKVKINKIKLLIPIFLYQIFILISGLASKYSIMGKHSSILYIIYVLVVLSVIYVSNKEDFDPELFITIGWWLSGILCLVLLFLLTKNFTKFSITIFTSQGSDRLTLASIALNYLIIFLLYKPKTKFESIFRWIIFATALGNIALCNVRRSLITYIVVLLVHLFKTKFTLHRSQIRKILSHVIVTIIVIVVLLFILSKFEIVDELFNQYLKDIRWVIGGYLGKTSGLYNTGMTRNELFRTMWHEYTTNYTTSDILWGRGYMYRYLDFPFFQAFTDMGIFMGILYLIVQLFIPLLYIFEKTNNVGQQFLQYYVLTIVLTNFYSGSPYGYEKFVPLVFLSFVSFASKQSPNATENEKYNPVP